MILKVKPWTQSILITVEDPKTKFSVSITPFGGTIVDVIVPDKNGKPLSITYGQNTFKEYIKSTGVLGASIGRIVNRIAHSKFILDGKSYKLKKNMAGGHCIHGGKKGFSHRHWDVLNIINNEETNEVKIFLQYISPDKEEGFPGTLTTQLIYSISPMKINWEFKSTTDKTTIVNLTNHTYWNLDGVNSLIDNQILTVYSDKFSETDSFGLPTGKISDVVEENINLNNGLKFKTAFDTFGDVDHNFFLKNFENKSSEEDLIAVGEVYSPLTNIRMKIKTTEPCVQVYTGNSMKYIKSKGVQCFTHGAICLETQKVPNAINMPENADSVILRPDEIYYHKTEHIFEN